jgi:hypothetical protein
MCSTPFGDEHPSHSESDGAIPKANLHFTINHQEDFVCGFVVESNHDFASSDSLHEPLRSRFMPNKYRISVWHCKLRNRNDDRPVLRNYSTDQLWPARDSRKSDPLRPVMPRRSRRSLIALIGQLLPFAYQS